MNNAIPREGWQHLLGKRLEGVPVERGAQGDVEPLGAGVQVAWVDPSIPQQGPMSALFTFLDAWRAGRERRAVLERTGRGLREKARRGKVISRAAAPYGYRFDPETSILAVNEEEAKVVRMAFLLYPQVRLSIVKLADRLNRLGVHASGDGRRWYSSWLGRMLRNETYAGTLWHYRGQKVPQPQKQHKRRFVQRPKEEWVGVPVPAIVCCTPESEREGGPF